MCRVGPDRRNPLPAAGRHEVDRHRVEAELPFETDHERREQVVTRIGADVVDDALDDAQRVVACAVHEAVDETLGPMPGGLGDQGDGAGRGNEEPRRTGLAEQAPEPADEPGVDHRDPGREHHPFEAAMRRLLEARTTSDGAPRRSPRRRAAEPSRGATAAETTSRPGSRQSTTSRLDGTIASHAAAAPANSQPSSGSPAGRRWPTQ